jgi:hypothetical protein
MIVKRMSPLVMTLAMLFTMEQCSTIMAGQQQNNMKTEGAGKPREKALKQEGWRVPGIEEYKKVSRVKERQVTGGTVTQKVFEAEARPVVDLDGTTVGNIDQKGINVSYQIAKKKKRLFDVRDFSTYEVNGRVFAYGVTLVPVAIEKHTRVYVGAMYSLFYYDEDGDGRFETRYSGLPLPKTPTWVGMARK